ncbi:MAG TPA: ABC transporter substrate-binding protein [Chloroflexota bacterium]|nr:ABC transporter substrate-binding protein [Chloroflexota bacterium]
MRARLLALLLGWSLLAACRPVVSLPTGPSAAPAGESVPSSAAPQPVVIATAGFTAFNWALYAAEAQGFFAEVGLQPDWLVTESPPKTAQAVISGDAQVGTIGTDFVIDAVERGANLVIVGAEMRAPLMSLMVRPELRDWNDLRGKTLAVSGPQVAETLFTRKLLALHGLDPAAVDLVTVGSSTERYAALRSGAVTAAMLTQPFDLMIAGEGFRRLGDSTAVVTDYPFPTYTVRRDWATAHEGLLVRFLHATRRGHQWLYEPANAAAAIAILRERTRSEEALARQTYQTLIEEKRLLTPDGAITTAGVANVIALMAEMGRLTPPLPAPEKFLALHYLEQATATP